MGSSSRTITLGGGCFWCSEAVFERLRGVIAIESGYTNGHVVAPTYEQVCTGQTGHAEVVKLTYDPQRISLRQILEVFFAIHDPAAPDRQDVDIGPQYRSGIYVDDDADAVLARAMLSELDRGGQMSAATEVCRRENYWCAEDYHRHFCAKHPNSGYCALVVAPKVHRVQQAFAGLADSR